MQSNTIAKMPVMLCCLVSLITFDLSRDNRAAADSSNRPSTITVVAAPTAITAETKPTINPSNKNQSTHQSDRSRLPEPVLSNVLTLDQETLQESASKLFHDDMFLGLMGGAGYVYRSDFPLHPSVGTTDMETILLNRRFLKIHEELGKISQAEAAAIVNQQIAKLLAAYEPLFKDKSNELYKSNTSNFLMIMDTRPDPQPTVFGSRLALLGFVWIAGDLRLTDCHAAVVKIADLATSQRDHEYQVERSLTAAQKGRRGIERYMVSHASLYHRQILATALLGTASGIKDPESILKPLKLATITKTLKQYDADMSSLDVLDLDAGRAGSAPPSQRASNHDDKSTDGVSSIRRVSDMDDNAFDAIKKAAEDPRLSSNPPAM